MDTGGERGRERETTNGKKRDVREGEKKLNEGRRIVHQALNRVMRQTDDASENIKQ